MRIQIRTLPLWILITLMAVILLLSPFLLHTYRFKAELISNQEKWTKKATTEYEMILASNSGRDCTSGWNTIRVRDSKIIEAHNAESENCPYENFEQITIEALFDQIWHDCLGSRSFRVPFPVCNVTYDEELGYPKRLDTFALDDQGEYLPSLSISDITLYP